MNRKAEIYAAYEHLGTHAAHYDGMMTGTSVFGCLALRFLWQFSKEEDASYMAHLLAGDAADVAADHRGGRHHASHGRLERLHPGPGVCRPREFADDGATQ